MAAVDVDVVESALRDVNLSSGREIVLKPEQESAVRALLADRDVLAVLPTRYYKSLIYQMFVRVKNYELNGNAAILVISPLKSIIEDQLQEMDLLGYPAKDLANLSNDDIRRCNFKIAFATAEKVKEKPFRAMLVDSKSKLHRNISPILRWDFLELPHSVNSSSGFPGRLFPFWRSGVTVVGSSHLLVHSCKSLSSVSLPVAESLLQVTAV
ncbi:unnamed protein product [Porites lobata]|uniref:DNA 3'-5' helicase n=1 Tax=Porites lobata TaxID=104759 RepID=A0ABN8MS95_9CNID|nr:unnamed protein product [Porites lobata]